MKRFFALTAAAFLAAFFMGKAHANIGCTTENPHNYLTTELMEMPLARGISSRGALITIYVSQNSWSIIAQIEQPDKTVFCVLDIGSDFQPVEIKKKRNLK